MPHNQLTSSWTNIHYNSIVCRFCTSERKSLPRPLLDSMRAFSRALSAISQVWGRTGLKTRVMNNLLATFCPHFTRTFAKLLRHRKLCTSFNILERLISENFLLRSRVFHGYVTHRVSSHSDERTSSFTELYTFENRALLWNVIRNKNKGPI